MPASLLIRNQNGIYDFVIIATNGDEILFSDKFRAAFLCRKAANSVLQYCSKAHHYVRKDMPNGQYSFHLKDENEEILCTSQQFWSVSSRNYALQLMQRECEGMLIVEQ